MMIPMKEVTERLEVGDHGGTYCGNPLACAVASAVIQYLIDNNISAHVEEMSKIALYAMNIWAEEYSGIVKEVRGKGLLLLVEFNDEAAAARVTAECLSNKVFVTRTQGNSIRIFPALNIERNQLMEGLEAVRQAIEITAHEKR